MFSIYHVEIYTENMPARDAIHDAVKTALINDGWTITGVTDPNNWVDLPASYHNGAGGISFADGHSEIHKWLDASTKRVIQRVDFTGLAAGNSRDIDWLQRRTFAFP